MLPHTRNILEKAVKFHQNGQLDKAKNLYQEVLCIEPDEANALGLLGVIESQGKNHEKAVELLKKSIRSNPKLGSSHYNLALALKRSEYLTEALESFERSIKLKHCCEDSYVKCSEIYIKKKKLDKAVYCAKKALEINKNSIQAHLQLSHAYLSQDLYDKSFETCQKALKIDPNHALSHIQLALIYHHDMQFDKALDCYQRVVELDPNCNVGYYNMSHAQLLTGNFHDGWVNYEYRKDAVELSYFKGKKNAMDIFEGVPMLQNLEDVKGKKIFVWEEQGYGDIIQFSRYVFKLHESGAHVIFYVHGPLYPLMEDQFPCQLAKSGDSFDDVDYQIPLISLARIFKTDIHTIPCKKPYIVACEEKKLFWREKIARDSGSLNIGIAFSGNPNYPNDKKRSMKIKDFFPIFGLGNIFIIQKDINDKDRKLLKNYPNVCFLGDEIKDFSDTAGIIDNMDVILSVDTSLVHLAGALGKKTYVLLSKLGDWRWLIDRTDSPWYSSITLIRQKIDKDWSTVMEQAVGEIRNLPVGQR